VVTKKCLPCVVAAAGLATGASASVIVFDNFDVNNGYNCCTGATVSGSGSVIGTDYDHGISFVPATGGKIESIDIAMSYVTGSNDFTLELWDEFGGLPNTMISSWNVVGGMSSFGSNNLPVNILNSDPNAVLTASDTYFLIATSANDAWDAWNSNSIGDNGIVVDQTNEGAYFAYQAERGACRVTLVPAPGSAGLLGLACLAAARRRR
jgi:hypothetical protein